ncbi:hypothetical protein WJX77_009605 [Trebouxia sp. C0004]
MHLQHTQSAFLCCLFGIPERSQYCCEDLQPDTVLKFQRQGWKDKRRTFEIAHSIGLFGQRLCFKLKYQVRAWALR